jgi:CHAT domain-containing protein
MQRTGASAAFVVLLALTILPGPVLFVQAALAQHDQQATAAELAQHYQRWQQAQDTEERIALGERVLALDAALKEWPLQALRHHVKGELWFGLGNAYLDRRIGDRAANLENAIAAYEAALTVRTRETNPREWADTQNNLGLAYGERIRGDRADNREKAIAHLVAALTVRTREVNEREWAGTQNNLGVAYWRRIRGDRADNLEKAVAAYEAALTVRTRETNPREWADTQNNLGVAFRHRIGGNLADNLEMAIARLEEALTVRTREALPGAWAETQNNLAAAYRYRVRGDRADNMEKSIGALQAALAVMTREANPRDWAKTQTDLGDAYSYRIRGDRADNMEKAIASYELALTVRTREAGAPDWAQTQNNLAMAYWARIHGDRVDNLERAIAALEAALTVRTRESLPFGWAATQNNLGIAYGARIRGDRADNLEKSIAAYEAALTVQTREAVPREWAEAQNNLAGAYLDRIHGDRRDNLEKAIAAFEAALKVRTREVLPREHLRAGRRLGGALLETRKLHEAGVVYASAREAFLLLFGQGLNDAEARDLIAQAGPLFAEAAFAAAQRGEANSALALASEGRARMMAIALRLQTLDLPADRRRRLGELRAAIHATSRAVDSAQGLDRMAAVETLGRLRRELLALVKQAAEAKHNRTSALDQARALAGKGGAVVVPIITRVGGKILIVTNNAPSLATLDLPNLTTDRLNHLMRGEPNAGSGRGWLDAYNIHYLPLGLRSERWPEWLAAVSDLGRQLGELFGARLSAALKERGIKPGSRLVWLPTGALGILPLGLVQDSASGRSFADDYEIVYAPSLEALSAAQSQIARPAPDTLTIVINPTGDLSGTEKEGKLVASYFASADSTLLQRSAATPEAVLAALKDRSHWHFASHGMFCWRDVRQSALIGHGELREHCGQPLAGAPLTIARLLDADGLGRPRLVVLSACETGLYDISSNPDEFIGLPGTFTALGASAVVGTLWPVSDAATALLVAKFYEFYMGQRLQPPTALWRAQGWLRRATSAELREYAKMAARQGRMEGRHMAEIADELSEEAMKRSLNNAAFEWSQREGALKNPEAKHSSPGGGAIQPYAHPYFWAGFIHTGL